MRFADPGADDTHVAAWTVGGQSVADALQEDNLPADRALRLIDESISTLQDVRFALRNTTPSKERRAELKRQLSGVLADCETVRISIKE